MPFALRRPTACFHGGAFFSAIGERFATLDRAREIVNADVLDAWFPPAPGVLAALQEHLPWLIRTSPPTACGGLIDALADARGVPSASLLPGAGSSDLIFRAFPHWLTRRSRVLMLDPTYGEYGHVLEGVIGCRVDRIELTEATDYAVDEAELEARIADGYDLIVLVNPNSPTGRHIAPGTLTAMLRRAPARTRVWVDETYSDYAGPSESVERFAAASENVIVCKSLSKVYALSGMRIAYLCAGPHQLESLRAITPPWVVGLPAQAAAVNALADPAYYRERYAETRSARAALANGLRALDWHVTEGVANFVLCRLPQAGPNAAVVTQRAREHGLFVRDARTMSARFGDRMIRIAVKDAATNDRMLDILGSVTTA